MAGMAIADQMVDAGSMVMVQSNFSDLDGDMLSYTAMSDMMDVATATVDDMGMVTITGVAEGMATITVTASDPDGMSAMQTIMVTVMMATTDAPASTELTAPSDVVVSSLANTQSISVTWDTTSIENAQQIKVVLFNSGVTAVAQVDGALITINAANDPGSRTRSMMCRTACISWWWHLSAPGSATSLAPSKR